MKHEKGLLNKQCGNAGTLGCFKAKTISKISVA
jgi:hypothetical protein